MLNCPFRFNETGYLTLTDAGMEEIGKCTQENFHPHSKELKRERENAKIKNAFYFLLLIFLLYLWVFYITQLFSIANLRKGVMGKSHSYEYIFLCKILSASRIEDLHNFPTIERGLVADRV